MKLGRLVPKGSTFAERPQYISYYLLIAILLVLTIVNLAVSDRITLDTILLPLGLILKESSPVMLLALAVGLVIAAGKIDISTASLAGLVATAYACWYQSGPLMGWLILPLIFSIPFAHSLMAGYTIAYRKGPALIITWALGIIYTSISGIITFYATSREYVRAPFVGTSTSISLVSGDKAILSVGNWQSFDGLSIIAAWILFCATIIWVSQIDRIARAIGAARRSSRYIGIDEKRSLIFIFLLVGIFSSIAGILHATFADSASVADMTGKELTAVSVAVLGGTVLSGGYFSVRGIIAASIVYQTLIYLTRMVQSPILHSIETRIIEVVFAVILLALAALFGKLMSGDTEVVVVRTEER